MDNNFASGYAGCACCFELSSAPSLSSLVGGVDPCNQSEAPDSVRKASYNRRQLCKVEPMYFGVYFVVKFNCALHGGQRRLLCFMFSNDLFRWRFLCSGHFTLVYAAASLDPSITLAIWRSHQLVY